MTDLEKASMLLAKKVKTPLGIQDIINDVSDETVDLSNMDFGIACFEAGVKYAIKEIAKYYSRNLQEPPR